MPKNLFAVLKGFLLSVILLISLIIFGALALAFTPLGEEIIALVMNIGRYVCVFLGAMTAAFTNGSRGLWQGLAVGAVFFIFFILCRTLMALPAAGILTAGAIFLLCGALGGVAGIMLVK